MKKYLLIAFAVLGIAVASYAQYGRCQVTGNVEPTMSSSGSSLYVTCQNYNNYMVNVTVAIVVVDKNGDSCAKDRTIVIPANSSKKVEVTTCSGASADANNSSVRISVSKCD